MEIEGIRKQGKAIRQEIHVSAENLGEILMGDSIENSLYDVRTEVESLIPNQNVNWDEHSV